MSGASNLFKEVNNEIGRSLRNARDEGIEYDPHAEKEKKKEKGKEKEKPKLKEVGTTSRRFTAAGIGESLRSMSRMIRNEVTGFIVSGLSKFLRSSGQFRTMVSSVKTADKLGKQLSEQIEKSKTGKLDRDDPAVKALREKADKAMADVRKATETYLERKMRQRHANSLDELVGKNAYEQKRIDYAKNVLKNVKEYEAIANPDSPEAAAEKQNVKENMALQAMKPKKPDAKPAAAGLWSNQESPPRR